MTYEIRIDERALKAIQKTPKKDRKAIFRAIHLLSEQSRPPGTRPLKAADVANIYRLRVRNYRVIYQVLDREVLVYVIRVGNRKDGNRDLIRVIKAREGSRE